MGHRGSITFKDWNTPSRGRDLKGFSKIPGFCRIAKEIYGVKYGWCDTNCIDKSSSAELTEAINSMYRYYQEARCCLVYLADVSGDQGPLTRDNSREDADLLAAICRSRWFTRGWTLQELIAPSILVFFGHSWNELGSFQTNPLLVESVAERTGISKFIFMNETPPSDSSIATRMSWASTRR